MVEPVYHRDGITLYHGDCLAILPQLEAGSVDAVVTSPPYDDLRSYGGTFSFDWRRTIAGIYTIVREGGVVVWVVGDGRSEGSETGTSFRQCLFAQECGFRIHDTMIYQKSQPGGARGSNLAYWQAFEFMFVWSKGAPSTFNPIEDRPNVKAGKTLRCGGRRNRDGSLSSCKEMDVAPFGRRTNVWPYANGGRDIGHPAPFPLKLAQDHVESWTSSDSTILDPFMGSGTTGVACIRTGRRFIGIELERKYVDIAIARIEKAFADKAEMLPM